MHGIPVTMRETQLLIRDFLLDFRRFQFEFRIH
jgi:hypothetical protein